MRSKKVYVVLDPITFCPARILRGNKSWLEIRADIPVRLMDRSDAVGAIRKKIWERCKGYCEKCGDLITNEQMHMHEQVPRGECGEISLDNSIALCYNCHINGEHGDRRPKFNTKTP